MQVPAFLRAQITLGHIGGIPVMADNRWVAVFALMTAVTAFSIDPFINNFAASLVIGFAAAVLFFGSVFLHELAHVMAARMEGLKVVDVTLHPFGGLTRFLHPPETARAEFRIAIAGPAANLILAAIFGLLTAVSGGDVAGPLRVLLFTLAVSNLLIAVFNLLPGYPLDGGRVLRAYLWTQGRDQKEATLLTARTGQYIAAGAIVIGLVFFIIRGEVFLGTWIVLVGIFLFDSARSIISDLGSEINIRVEDVMMLSAAVEPGRTLQSFVDEVLPMFRRPVFLVADGQKFIGMLLLEDLKAADRDLWRITFVRDVMRPRRNDLFVYKGTSLADAKFLMATNKIGAVAVLDDDGKLLGLLHRTFRTKHK